MKKGAFIIVVFTFLILVQPVSAHLVGQPPFFKVNGQYADFYHISSASLPDFILPQDIAPENYLVNQPIEFELDPATLPVPANLQSQTKFSWDFGDGQKGQGLKNTYAYKEFGSFIMTIHADVGMGAGPQLLQSTFLNILPSQDYQLPKAVIKVGGQEVKDPIKIKFTQEIELDGRASSAPSSTIREYFWDLGDGASSSEPSLKHKYLEAHYNAKPILRIKDADGFIADSTVEIINEENDPKTAGATQSKPKSDLIKYVVIGILVTILSAALIFKAKKIF